MNRERLNNLIVPKEDTAIGLVMRDAADSELLTLFVVEGDRDCMVELICRYYRPVLSVARRLLSDENDADDAVQATFLVFIQSSRKIRKSKSVGAWLYGVAYRIANRMREKSTLRKQNELDSVTERVVDNSESPIDQVARKMQLEALDDELQKTRSTYRDVLVEHYLLGYSASEIAIRFELSQSTVEGRLRRGRNDLRKRLLKRGCSFSAAILVFGSANNASASQSVAATQIVEASEGSSLPLSDVVSRLVSEEVNMITFVTSKFGFGAAMATAGVAFLGLLAMQSAGQSPRSSTGETTVIEAIDKSTKSTSAAAGIPPQRSVSSVESEGANVLGQSAATAPAWATTPASRNRELLSATELEFHYNGTPLQTVVATLGDELNVPIHIDAPGLEAEGVDGDVPVVLDLPGAVSVRQGLNYMLSPHGLSYRIDRDIIVIGSKSQLDKMPAIRVYDLELLLDESTSATELAQFVEKSFRMIEPEMWLDETWSSQVLGKARLAVSTSERIHYEIDRLLAELAQGMGKSQPRPVDPNPIVPRKQTAPLQKEKPSKPPRSGNPFGS